MVNRPRYVTDVVVFAYERGLPDLWVLLVRRGKEPFEGAFALPGGHVNEGETSRGACARELLEETGLPFEPEHFFPVGVFDNPGRDPRGWCVSSAFGTLVDFDAVNPYVKAGDDALSVAWFSMSNPPPDLAFDHLEVISRAASTLSWMLDGNSPFMDFKYMLLKDRETLKTILNSIEGNNETKAGQEDGEAEGSDPTKRRVGDVKPFRAVDKAGRKTRRESEAENEYTCPHGCELYPPHGREDGRGFGIPDLT